MGKKRTSSGKIKAQSEPQHPPEPTSSTQPAPPCAQPQLPPNANSESQRMSEDDPEDPEPQNHPTNNPASEPYTQTHPSKPQPKDRRKRQKHTGLPKNATITKRPLLHPAIAPPFASAQTPKILYITASTPFIPCIKRICKLLSLIEQRAKQSLAAQSKRKGRKRTEANGRLAPKDVERDIVDGVSKTSSVGEAREKVYLKATGRAIPRALSLGVHFQMEENCVVKVEMGNVRAIDDVEVPDGEEGDEVPETRLRTLSTVTVSIERRG